MKFTKFTKLCAAVVLIITALFTSSVPAQAACSTPACVKTAAKEAMDESGMDIAFVVRVSRRTGKGTAYMMYKTSRGSVKCDRSGQVILGKDSLKKIDGKSSYSFWRSMSLEKKILTWKKGNVQYRHRYTSYVECARGSCFNLGIHSYIEYRRPGRAWTVCKGTGKNTTGLAMCREYAHYLWSVADHGCPVVFIIK